MFLYYLTTEYAKSCMGKVAFFCEKTIKKAEALLLQLERVLDAVELVLE